MLRSPLLLLALLTVPLAAQDAARLEFFEQRIRPVLVERCYQCHNSSGKRKADLALDDRSSLRRGGRSGAAIVVGHGNDSLLVRALRHEDTDLRMPAQAAKLADDVIADFVRWIDDGAIDPREQPPTADELSATLSWDAVRQRRMQWWSWRPLADPPVPAANGAHPVDCFVMAELTAAGLQPAPRADRRTLIRRLTFALIGLPPTPAEVEAFVVDETPGAYDALVDRLLASPHFGERWARHWMDWVRYVESHGSEGDPAIPFAWRYRDYLIRALNDDVPYDQIVREHIAGDLLPEPRLDRAAAIDESRLGTAQFRFVQHGFAPTDPIEEQVRFTDNQIDVLSKAFLGLTVSCARCHDHKFDAIGQRDYYALFGIFASCRPATVTVDTPERAATNKAALAERKTQIKQQLAGAWLAAVERLPAQFALAVAVKDAASDDLSPLHPWRRARAAAPDPFAETWTALVLAWQQSRASLARQQAGTRGWDLSGDDYRRWFAHGAGLAQKPSPPGEFSVHASGDRIVADLLPAGVYSHALSTRHNGVLGSPRFTFDMPAIYVRVAGGGGAKVRYVVQNYPRDGTVYPIHTLQTDALQWVRWDTAYWHGDQGHLEIGTAADQPVVGDPRAQRSWFGIARAVFVSAEQVARGEMPRDESAEFVTPLFDAAAANPPTSAGDLDRLYVAALRVCIGAWIDGTMTDEQARFLGFFVRAGLLPARLSELPQLTDLVAEYRKLEAAVPVPTRAPGVLEADAFDQPFLPRGDHRQPGEPVRHGFLAAIDDRPYRTGDSGRLQLANDFVRADNPLTPRVAVNRIWHHLFGRGLVATTDNFGQLGERPSHPELLDHLARRFVDSGWSIKQMIRLLVTAEVFCRDSRAPAGVAERDPGNLLLSHFRVQRLQAEAIRDALLAVSGELDGTMFGTSVDGDSHRRSVYVRVMRNDLDPLLRTFDAPEPHTTRGQRDATNVPAQALALLNDPFVRARAEAWATAVAIDTDERRLQQMFEASLGRRPSTTEVAQARRFLAELARRDAGLEGEAAGLDTQIAASRRELAALTEPIRQRLLAANSDVVTELAPIACWEFDDDLTDSIGALHGIAHGVAHLEDGALVLDGASHVETAKLTRDLRAKTLEARVVLDGLEQRGGGVISVETIGGGAFDAIVFGEKEPRQWLPGSDFFHRSRNPGGAAEAVERAVHLAITYAEDGTIATYRDGEPYGEPYRVDGPVTFAAGDAVVLFGLRHSPADGGRRLRGRILDARLYDRALTADEVAASARGERRFVGRSQLLAAMTEGQRADSERLETLHAELSQRRAQLEQPAGFAAHPERLWRDYALCLFTLKEFLYVQ